MSCVNQDNAQDACLDVCSTRSNRIKASGRICRKILTKAHTHTHTGKIRKETVSLLRRRKSSAASSWRLSVEMLLLIVSKMERRSTSRGLYQRERVRIRMTSLGCGGSERVWVCFMCELKKCCYQFRGRFLSKNLHKIVSFWLTYVIITILY